MCQDRALKLLRKTNKGMTANEIQKKIGCNYVATSRALRILSSVDKLISVKKKKLENGYYANLYKIKQR